MSVGPLLSWWEKLRALRGFVWIPFYDYPLRVFDRYRERHARVVFRCPRCKYFQRAEVYNPVSVQECTKCGVCGTGHTFRWRLSIRCHSRFFELECRRVTARWMMRTRPRVRDRAKRLKRSRRNVLEEIGECVRPRVERAYLGEFLPVHRFGATLSECEEWAREIAPPWPDCAFDLMLPEKFGTFDIVIGGAVPPDGPLNEDHQ